MWVHLKPPYLEVGSAVGLKCIFVSDLTLLTIQEMADARINRKWMDYRY